MVTTFLRKSWPSFNARLEAAVSDWGDALEDYFTDKQGEPK